MISKIRDLLNSQSPKWSTVRTQLRGIPLYPDQLLKGLSRFSRKTGLPGLINPDTEIYLAQDAQATQNQIIVNRFNQWFTVGSYIQINNVEKFQITKIENLTLTLNDEIKIATSKGLTVTLYSSQAITLTQYLKNATTIQIRSLWPLIIGDKIAFNLYKNLFKEIKVINVKDLGKTSNPYPFTYELELETGTPHDLTFEQPIQVRAFPAYFSEILKVPRMPFTSNSIGPFVLDWFCGKLQNGTTPEMFATVQMYDVFSQKAFSENPILIPQNYPVFARSINYDIPMFWNILKGSLKLKDNSIVCVTDADGYFGITQDLQPNALPGNQWKINIYSENDVTFRISFEPNDFVTYPITAFQSKTITVGTQSQNYETIEKITITAKSTPNTQFEIGPWILQGQEVERLSFGIMSYVTTEAEWLSSSVIIKPMFLLKDYLSAVYDSEAVYDSGYVEG